MRLADEAELHDATLLAVAYDCDLALLHVDSPAFCRAAAAVGWGKLPQLNAAVTAAGYPLGDSLAITSGVASRVEVVPYAFSGRQLLSVQVDAAVNPGCWGGGLFNARGECVGVLLQVRGGLRLRGAGVTRREPRFLRGWGQGVGAPGLGERTGTALLQAEAFRCWMSH